jgi:hypothetical protein
MRLALLIPLFLLPLLCSCTEAELQQFSRQVAGGLASGPRAELSLGEIAAGLREALRVGSSRVVAQIGRPDGFYGDANIRIPLPADLQKARELSAKLGLDRSFVELEELLNRAAEKAAPLARELFWQAIAEMSLDDVQQIFRGPDDAATRYFERKMTPQLARALRPVVEATLDQVGVVRQFKQVLREYRKIPFAPRLEADLTGYVLEKEMAGIFYYLAREEAAIRRDPLKRSTEILRRVFG